MTVMNIANIYDDLKDCAKAEELYQRALEGKAAQLGKEHHSTKYCAKNLAMCFARAREKEKLRKIVEEYPHIIEELPAIMNNI